MADVFASLLRPDTLLAAWDAMRRNKGSAGGDGVTIRAFSRDPKAQLDRLRGEVMDRTYMPGPVRRVDIPKKGGGTRTLSIPCLRDRVLQKAMALTLSDRFEAEFEDCSFAYRPGRSVEMAQERVLAYARSGFVWLVDADIKSFFDAVPHMHLLRRLSSFVPDRDVVGLVAQWLDGGDGEAAHNGTGRGLPQGGPMSPHLANLYLDDLDERLMAEGARLVRYADDFVLLTRTRAEAERLMNLGEAILSGLGLAFHPDKTVVQRFDDGFDFLGRHFALGDLTEDEEGLDAEERAYIDALDEVAPVKKVKRQARLAGQWLEPPEQPFVRDEPPIEDYAGRPVLHVLTKGQVVDADEGALRVRQASSEIWARSSIGLARLEVGEGVEVTGAAIRLLAATNVPVFWVSPGGKTLAETHGDPSRRAELHLLQAAAALDPQQSLALSRKIAAGRILSARAVLMGWRVDLKGREPGPRSNQERIERTITAVDSAKKPMLIAARKCSAASDKAALLSLEAEGCKQWWSAFRASIWPLKMGPRSRPAEDLPNAVINYISSLLTRDMVLALRDAGLHDGIGLYHASRDYASALAYDLVEPFRAPIAGRIARHLFNTGRITADDGILVRGEYRLLGGAVGQIIGEYHRTMDRRSKSVGGKKVSYREILRIEAVGLRDHLVERTPFEPWQPDY